MFFFKQKTAYEMRISDWSSDVCSSDLMRIGGHNLQHLSAFKLRQGFLGTQARQGAFQAGSINFHVGLRQDTAGIGHDPFRAWTVIRMRTTAENVIVARSGASGQALAHPGFRSEEHTYELQSIMRISYDVFC